MFATITMYSRKENREYTPGSQYLLCLSYKYKAVTIATKLTIAIRVLVSFVVARLRLVLDVNNDLTGFILSKQTKNMCTIEVSRNTPTQVAWKP